MDSSTSSFRTELKVIAAVVVLLGAWEVVCRVAGPELDYDRRHIHAFPQIVQRLGAAGEPRVLLLGNSLMLHGVDPAVVDGELATLGLPGAAVERITPVGTTVLDWYYLVRRYARDGPAPDLVVVGFGPAHLDDDNTKRLPRLGRHFLAWADMPELFERDIPGFEQQCQIVLSRSLAMFGDHLLWQEGVGSCLVPDFQEGTRRLSHLLDQHQTAIARDAPAATAQAAPRYDRVRRLVRLLRDRGSRVVFVAFPANGYDLPPGIAEAVTQEGGSFVDARSRFTDASDYADGYHLSEASAEAFSGYLATVVRDALAPGDMARQ